MKRFLTRFRDDDSGATAIEYGLIIALIFLAILGSLTAFGDATNGLFQTAMTAINSAMGG
jgi:pilus assembly protein Flp/PilA